MTGAAALFVLESLGYTLQRAARWHARQSVHFGVVEEGDKQVMDP
jgi:hypothetical protein